MPKTSKREANRSKHNKKYSIDVNAFHNIRKEWNSSD